MGILAYYDTIAWVKSTEITFSVFVLHRMRYLFSWKITRHTKIIEVTCAWLSSLVICFVFILLNPWIRHHTFQLVAYHQGLKMLLCFCFNLKSRGNIESVWKRVLIFVHVCDLNILLTRNQMSTNNLNKTRPPISTGKSSHSLQLI